MKLYKAPRPRKHSNSEEASGDYFCGPHAVLFKEKQFSLINPSEAERAEVKGH